MILIKAFSDGLQAFWS